MSANAHPIQPWLWPDHVAGKRETRRLREEHNHAINEHEKLRNKVLALRLALKNIAGASANENSEPDAMADTLGEIQGIVRHTLEATKETA